MTKVEKLNISQLADNPLQPESRATDDAVADLLEQYTHTGYLQPVVVSRATRRYGGRYVIIDGHRRKRVAEIKGLKQLDCIVLDEDPEEGFLRLNRGIRRVSGKVYFYGWAKASDQQTYLRLCPKSTSGNIREMVRIFGHAEAHKLALAEVDPAIVCKIGMCARFLIQWAEPVALKVIGRWMLKHRATYAASVLAAQGGRVEALRLRRRIIEDKPYALRRMGAKPGARGPRKLPEAEAEAAE